MYRLLWIAAVLVISGCVTTVSSIQEDNDVLTDPKMGYLLLSISSNTTFSKMVLDGPSFVSLTSRDLKAGTRFLIVPLKAGSYEIERLDMSLLWNSYHVFIDNGEKWRFNVEPGKVSYSGHLTLENESTWFAPSRVMMRIDNYASEALEFMEANYPNLLAKRGIVYTGPGEDNFFKLVEHAKQAHAATTSGGQ